MTASPSLFEARTPGDNARLVREHPLAWIVSSVEVPGSGADGAAPGAAGAPHATLLPVQAHTDSDGRITRLVGHFARRNPQVAALKRQPQAMFLFLGPHGYISPSWMADRTQAPTWNYASLRCHATVRLHADEQRLRDEIRALVDAQEAGRPAAWSVDDMGERYAKLAGAIVGFEAEVMAAQGKFKLGQDERGDVFADIVRGLAAQPGGASDPALLAWMREFNVARPA